MTEEWKPEELKDSSTGKKNYSEKRLDDQKGSRLFRQGRRIEVGANGEVFRVDLMEGMIRFGKSITLYKDNVLSLGDATNTLKEVYLGTAPTLDAHGVNKLYCDTNLATAEAYCDAHSIETFGDGSDGALAISSGTTTLDLTGLKVFRKNYTSISITGTGKLAFSNPHASGTTVVVFYNQGALTLTSSTVPCIELGSLGSTAGTGGAANAGGNGNNGTSATMPEIILNNIYNATLDTNGKYGSQGLTNPNAAGGVASNKPVLSYRTTDAVRMARHLILVGAVGAGGGGGGSGRNSEKAGGNGGRGAGSLIILSNGALNFTGTINANGSDGSDGAGDEVAGGISRGGGGGGGGGAGGMVLIGVGSITANSGTINTDGGDGGDGMDGARDVTTDNSGGGGGGSGGSSFAYGLGGTGTSSGVGGVGGYDNGHPSVGGQAGDPFPTAGYGAGGAAGSGNAGTYGAGSSSGGGGGGGGGAKGYSLIATL
jgi:hypothetical protein